MNMVGWISFIMVVFGIVLIWVDLFTSGLVIGFGICLSVLADKLKEHEQETTSSRKAYYIAPSVVFDGEEDFLHADAPSMPDTPRTVSLIVSLENRRGDGNPSLHRPKSDT